tara:strand:+ start:1557 stop:2213 length:657 start_codon:yes stop_codon:yes gene_type:complete
MTTASIKQTFFKLFRTHLTMFISRKGQSLAEFAVITAMMSTFVMTAVPKFSNIMEVGKANKSIEELDKMILVAKKFYEEASNEEGRGRLPGQDKFDMKVGGYTDLAVLLQDLENFTTSDNSIGTKWVSVFGTINGTPSGSNFQDDIKDECSNCNPYREKGSDEWYHAFSREILTSPFQDGHYIYIIIPGEGSGDDAKSPKICVADAENPKHLHKFMEL